MTPHYPTISARTILIPELSVSLTVEATEVGDPLVRLLKEDASADVVEESLGAVCQSMFGVPWSSVITFTRWMSLTRATRDIVDGDNFQAEMTSTYAGGDASEAAAVRRWLSEARSSLNDTLDRWPTAQTFAAGFIQNSILNARQSEVLARSSVLSYRGRPTLPQSILWDLRERGYAELEAIHWQRLLARLTAPCLPTSKVAFEAVSNYEFAFPGSPELKRLKLPDFIQLVRGAAIVPLATTAYETSALIHDRATTDLLVCVLSGAVTTLCFIGIGRCATAIEKFRFAHERRGRSEETD